MHKEKNWRVTLDQAINLEVEYADSSETYTRDEWMNELSYCIISENIDFLFYSATYLLFS